VSGSRLKIYGIRHHGPGCARSLVKALGQQKPDLLLLEAPAECDNLLADSANPEMKPPVAALIYQADSPSKASFYPFAKFSPEWQAQLWAHANECVIKSFDLPVANSIALDAVELEQSEREQPEDQLTVDVANDPASDPVTDPLAYFAQADGYTDGERWWNDKVEERADSASFFDAILEAVTALRKELGRTETPRTLLREAWMRKQIRSAKKDGYDNIAVICGAWHAPELAGQHKVSDDNALLKSLPKVKVSATWTPWTYERLAAKSGYSAGIRSPGWYDHLWSDKRYPFTTWMTRAARVLRKQEFEGSSASIIEATRLAEALAGMRGRPQPGLDESLEAMRTVFCAGDATPLAFLEKPLLIGQRLGSVPEEIIDLPLQRDVEKWQKRLRLKPTGEARELVLDLREDSGRNRSVFLHRLLILDINYGKKVTTRSRTKGTFKENWKLSWSPAMVLAIIDASRFGNTLESAASNALLDSGSTNNGNDENIQDITESLDLALLADLPGITARLVSRLENTAATTTDAIELMQAVPALVRIVRYGDVRQTDGSLLNRVLLQLTARVHAALPSSCTGLADETASSLAIILRRYAEALELLQQKETLEDFYHSLHSVAANNSGNPEPRGCASRLLYDASQLDAEKTAEHFAFALSQGNEPADAAAWLEGFLSGTGSVLVHDTALLALIDNWLKALPKETFVQVLPMLRRTVGRFTAPERSKIGEAVRSDNLHAPAVAYPETDDSIDWERARPAVATVTRLFDLPGPD